MSFKSNLRREGNLYIIPRGCKDIKKVVRITSGDDTHITVYFPEDAYQLITDGGLINKGVTLQKYIEQTESWRARRK